MSTVYVSAEFEVAIPAAIRRSLGIQPGQAMQVNEFDNRVELIPVRPMQHARGLRRGIDTSEPTDSEQAGH